MTRKITLGYLPFFFMLFFTASNLFAQESRVLEGQILADSIQPANVHVVNLDLEKGTTSDENGKFMIIAEQGDRILFSSVQFQNREIVIKQEDIESGKIGVTLFPARNELDEVKITDLKLSGHLDLDVPKIKYFEREKYGIPYAEKKLTQTERRLYTANAGVKSRWSYFGILLGGLPLDVLMNDINGKTKYLKALQKQEQLQLEVQSGIDVLGKSFFIEDLDLPETEIENFVYYCARDPKFQDFLSSNNRLELIEFYNNKRQDFINLRQINDGEQN
ncbi:carboxypeptidase-like regulatory domain-containing protein [Christiangramia sp. SM2212]|uniref:CarboxypepD_reg-like domain-containing protein n=1 Tax=Christiangramia sediminicola TaxID=3073267 RepID=A0ABU1EV30_9FLAO|nr:carboxypeptidase-like regulatory domain-containing protein [Christiangramia sp. SM2212]MDR5591849.1 hypothetical protein [Christiangramia sp. SM2212]